MLRLRSQRRGEFAERLTLLGLATVVPKTQIIPVFSDPLLESVRLLREAANIEHALMVQYLFASFTVKEEYAGIVGSPQDTSIARSLLGVAIQEMRHLARVTEILVQLGSEPNLDREDFPIRTDLYPFALELESLTLASLAKYITAESPIGALDPATATDAAERLFRTKVATLLGGEPVNHIGSLYGTIMDTLATAVRSNPEFIPKLQGWLVTLEAVREQGEAGHFAFFCSLFRGTHDGLSDASVWDDPSSGKYPSINVMKNPTSFEGSAYSITDPEAHQYARLGVLQYWLVLSLLYRGKVLGNQALLGRASSHMTGCIYPLGHILATKLIGMPFDPAGMSIDLFLPSDAGNNWVKRLIREIQALEAIATPQNANALYSTQACTLTLKMLGG